jgi:hypothetical protein
MFFTNMIFFSITLHPILTYPFSTTPISGFSDSTLLLAGARVGVALGTEVFAVDHLNAIQAFAGNQVTVLV